MRSLVVASLILFLVVPLECCAYETDQFSHRQEPISDSTVVLDAKVNATLADIVRDWHGSRNDWKFVMAVFHRLGGYYWVDKIEEWASESPDIQRLQTSRWDSIYHSHPLWASRVAGLFGVGSTIKLNNQFIGSDKLGHFFSQGKKFYHRYELTHDEALAAERSAYTERAIFGQMTTGVYSNADLVANYEGCRFYRSLFEDNIIPGKPAILAWQDDHWIIQRPFTFADHVNAYWDEALNISHYDKLLYPYMKTRLMTFCPDYQAAPELWVIEDEQSLQERYALLQLRDTSELRLNFLCPQIPSPAIRESAKPLD
ncbi:MAG: hypothetical protein EXR85_05960 [Xanthomonadales bacterium]|nr:hypothetical protein [Xanthomonadales bacterium]